MAPTTSTSPSHPCPWLVWVALHTPRHSHRSALERLFFPLFGQPPNLELEGMAATFSSPPHRLFHPVPRIRVPRDGSRLPVPWLCLLNSESPSLPVMGLACIAPVGINP